MVTKSNSDRDRLEDERLLYGGYAMEQNRTWIYCRIAHDGPASTEALTAQRHSLGTYAKEHGLEVVGSSNDMGSGLTIDRPGLLDFHAAAESGEIDILLIRNLTHLGRDSNKVIGYWSLLRDLGVSIHTVDRGEIDLSLEHTMLCGMIGETRKRPR